MMTASYETTPQRVLDLDHVTRDGATLGGESIAVHALMADRTRTTFAHGRSAAVASGSAKANRKSARVVLEPVEGSSPVAVAAIAPKVPHSWSWTTAIHLDLPDGATIPLAQVTAPEIAARLPLLADGTFHAEARADVTPLPSRTEYHQWTEGASPAFALPSSPIAIQLSPGPDLLVPSALGTLSLRDRAFEWTHTSEGTQHTLRVIDVARGELRFVATTPSRTIEIARLARLGLPALAPGPHLAELSTDPNRRSGVRAPFEVVP
jgi:hypothetical protein